MLQTLQQDALLVVMSHLHTIQDLLHLSRTCMRLSQVVRSSDSVWEHLFVTTYPKAVHSASSHPVCFRDLFKERWVKDAKEQRLQRKVARMRLQSDAQQLQRELRQMEAQLRCERQQQQRIKQQLQRLQRTLTASTAAAGTQWQLSAVKLYHNKLVQAAPIQSEAHLAALQQQQKVSQVETKTLAAGIAARRQRLAITQRRLAALDG